MEEINKNYHTNYNKVNSPIFNYYSDIVNSPNLSQNSENIINTQIQFPQNFESMTLQQKLENDKRNKINEPMKEDKNYAPKNNYFKHNEGNNILNENNTISTNNTNNKSNETEKKNIKTIKPEDLIPTSINGRVILRINPLIYRNESYEFLANNIYLLLKDQLGCKYLQEKLETDTLNAFQYFYPAILPHLSILIKDSFANYFIQKLYCYLNEEQIEYILNTLQPEFFDICSDSHGTRAIQAIINFLFTAKLRFLFFDIIKPIFISLINELNGTHIINKFINFCPEFSNNINSIIMDNCINLATHKRGCFFLQNYLTMLINNKSDLKINIINKLLDNCLILITDNIGNYIIQYLLTLREQNIISNIINQILNNISFYSKHKYSNYVIEKLFLFSDNENRNKIIEKISKPEIMSDLVIDQQGNYIVLKALMFSDDEKRNIMLNIINNLEPKIKKFSHGKNFLNKIYNIRPFINDYNYKTSNNKNNKNSK